MAYRRPGIEVIQEFQQSAAALSLPALPACIVGPGFQIKNDVEVGAYSETDLGTTSYAYTGVAGGGIVDLSDTPEEAAEVVVHKAVGLTLKNAYLVKLPALPATTVGTGKLLTPNIFQDLTSGAFSAFDPDASGAPTYYLEVLSGAGIAAADLGRKLIIRKTDDNNLVVAAEWQSALPFTPATYRVLEFRETEVYEPATFADHDIVASSTSVAIQPGLDSNDEVPLPVVEATVALSWRALRPDLANTITAFTDLDSLEAVFGIGAVVPENIGAYAVNLALLNTTTAVNYTGLSGEFFTDEEAAWQTALEYLEGKDVYAIPVMTHNPAVHQLLSAHVTQMSQSSVGRERVGFISRKLVETEVLVPASGIGHVLAAGVSSGLSGANNLTFKDPTHGSFITDDVHVGHFLEIESYTAAAGIQRSVEPNERDYLSNADSTLQLVNAEFAGTDVGRFLIVKGATTPANSVVFEITDDTSTTKAEVTPAPSTDEVLPPAARVWIADLDRSIAHNALDTVVAATRVWHFVGGAFVAGDVGKLLVVRGAAAAGDNGTFTISEVTNATDIKTLEAPGADETFGGGVTQSVYAINREPGRDSTSDSVLTSRQWTVLGAAFTAEDVGRVLRVGGATNAGNNADHVIETVVSSTVVKTDNTTTPVTEVFNGLATTLTTLDIVSTAPNETEDTYITGTRHEIASIVSENQFTLVDDPAAGFGGALSAVQYRITRDLTLDEQAAFIAGYATTFGNRRLLSTWPDVLAVSVNGTIETVPGYFAGAVLAGMTAGLPSQSGFTHMAMTGFVGRAHSDDKFSDVQLDVIAGGGNLVLTQPVAGAALVIRHQVTTDVTTIFFQEFSVTKNIDLIARFFRLLYAPYIGTWNITDGLLDILKTRGEGGLTFLKGAKAPRVGAPLKSGQLSRISESATMPDTVEIDVTCGVPLPLNGIILTLLV